MSRAWPRLAFACFATAMVLVFGVVSWLSPLQGEDWERLRWSSRHAGNAWAWIATHFTFSDLLGYTLAHSTWFHTLVSPLVTLALVIGTFTIAMRRLPRTDAWEDVIGVMLVSALIWITQARPGFTLFHRPNVAWHVYGCALAVWTIAPLLCGWRPRRAAAIVLGVAAFLVGGTTPQIAVPTLVVIAVHVLRARGEDRPRWHWIVLVALVAGTILGFIDAPHVHIPKVVNRGLELNVLLLNFPVQEGGQLIALVMLLALAKLVLDAFWQPAPRALPDTRQAQHSLVLWLGICVLSLFGPRVSDATLLPGTIVLCAAALPWFPWLAATRTLRYAIVAFVIGLHAIVWTIALGTFLQLGGEFRERMEILEAAPDGSIPVIRPYTQVFADAWFAGEDWTTLTRQLVAIDVFGVRDFDFEPAFGKLEENPGVEIRLEIEGADPEHVRATAPAFWATDLTSARAQFVVFTKLLERVAGKTFTARLVVDNLAFPERAGRPLYAAWYERGTRTGPRITRSRPDFYGWQTVTMPSALARQFPEAYAVRDGSAASIEREAGRFRLRPTHTGLIAIVACDAQRCIAVDAYLPRL